MSAKEVKFSVDARDLMLAGWHPQQCGEGDARPEGPHGARQIFWSTRITKSVSSPRESNSKISSRHGREMVRESRRDLNQQAMAPPPRPSSLTRLCGRAPKRSPPA